MIKVIHSKDKERYPYPERVYIGRGSPLGNPFTHLRAERTKAVFQCGSRFEAINRYRPYIAEKIASKDPDVCLSMNSIYRKALEGNVYLVCFCAPESCHGDVIKQLVEEKIRILCTKEK